MLPVLRVSRAAVRAGIKGGYYAWASKFTNKLERRRIGEYAGAHAEAPPILLLGELPSLTNPGAVLQRITRAPAVTGEHRSLTPDSLAQPSQPRCTDDFCACSTGIHASGAGFERSDFVEDIGKFKPPPGVTDAALPGCSMLVQGLVTDCQVVCRLLGMQQLVAAVFASVWGLGQQALAAGQPRGLPEQAEPAALASSDI